MSTTTIRVNSETHARLAVLSRATVSIETVRAATEALERQRFAIEVASELEDLRRDEGAWSARLGEPRQPQCPMASVEELWLVVFGVPHLGEPVLDRPALVHGPPDIFGAAFRS